MKAVEPIHTVELFAPLSAELLSVLRQLSLEEWQAPTACGAWRVRDVAAHLLGGSLGRVRDDRDRQAKPAPVAVSFPELVQLINQDNEEWVQAARRITPSLLVAHLELADRRLADYFLSLDEMDWATVAVAWAGDIQSPVWFDVAREYTEKWLHQQHIREAVHRPLLTSRDWLYPVLDTFMRALPHTYRSAPAENGVEITIAIHGEAGGIWTLRKEASHWVLFSGAGHQPVTQVHMDQDLAWRLFTKGIDLTNARLQVKIIGDESLGLPVLQMVSLMA